jgi:hypothetical protein
MTTPSSLRPMTPAEIEAADDLEDAQIAASRYEDWKAGRSRTYTLEEAEQRLGLTPSSYPFPSFPALLRSVTSSQGADLLSSPSFGRPRSGATR